MIRAVLYDAGGVLHTSQPDQEMERAYAEEILKLLEREGAPLKASPQQLLETLKTRGREYKKYVEEHKVELPGLQILREFYLKDYDLPAKALEGCAEEICYLHDARRSQIAMRPCLPETVRAVHDLRIRQGVISNIISRTFVPEALERYGVAEYMECVVMSSEAGIRKPDPRIFYLAAEQMDLKPEEICYIGDTVSRDVIGSRKAGLGLMIQIHYAPTQHKDLAFLNSGYQPDYKIQRLSEIPPILIRERERQAAKGGAAVT